MRNKYILTFAFALFSILGMAQEKTYTSRLSFGVGRADVMDTYLSPYSYTGFGFLVGFEKEYTHTLRRLDMYVNYTENPAGNVDDYSWTMKYGIGHLLTLKQSVNNLELKVGGIGVGNFGILYNERNGNNPAQAKISLTANVIGRAAYQLKNTRLQASLEIPVIGIAYSPMFGQSYYEEWELGNSDHNCVFAHIGNMPSMHLRLTAGYHKWLIGADFRVDQSKFNHLRYHEYQQSFVIGYEF